MLAHLIAETLEFLTIALIVVNQIDIKQRIAALQAR